ncbi:MAG TPA: PEP-CTERM sorting domain-containing protein [Terriglobales bacterium]|nr:PEP-CTERM sorting domain-containing protein [Terriglobales bacterium]
MKLRALGLGLICLLTLAGTSLADTVTLTGAGPANQGGVYVYPYTLNINGTSYAGICDDYSHEVYIGESWTANIYTMGQYLQARFGTQTNAGTEYNEAAWLFSQIGSAPSSEVGDINFAIWSLFTPSTPVQPVTGTLLGSQYWLNVAGKQAFTPGEFDNYRIVTPVATGPSSPQEYLITVPEPSSLLMLGSGLIGLAGLFKKKFLS